MSKKKQLKLLTKPQQYLHLNHLQQSICKILHFNVEIMEALIAVITNLPNKDNNRRGGNLMCVC